ncbi:MAG: hypothetical protein EAZ51_02870 [Sphingobacteriales bacterium]|nr:MAG: hypothetical protein EAZ64_07450 [Sphingobacteriales bacterium]TAF82195.1 MAG: hypothetical protein EAZ51_02870 [Sphingobacteriales bacterium]
MLAFTFILITLLSLLFFYMASESDKRFLTISLLWISIVTALAIFGFFKKINTTPPRFLIVILGNIVFVFFALKFLKKVNINTNFLLLVHALRLPVEIGLYQLFLQKQIPRVMTFEGYNFDILIGISAILLFAYVHLTQKSIYKIFFLLWNFVGIFLLTTIVVIAIISAPLPIQLLGFEQPNVAVLKFPFILLPAFIVPVVFLSHILAIKNLNKH